MKAVEPVEPCPNLPLPPRELDPALRDPDAGLRAEEGVAVGRALATCSLVGPEPAELRQERVGEEDIATTATLRDLGADSYPRTGSAIRKVNVSDVEPHKFSKAEA